MEKSPSSEICSIVTYHCRKTCTNNTTYSLNETNPQVKFGTHCIQVYIESYTLQWTIVRYVYNIGKLIYSAHYQA